MRVLLITNTYPTEERPGDTPNIKDQREDLHHLGVSTDLLYIDGSRKLNYLKGALKVLALTLKPRKYDIIHAFYGHSGLLAQLQWKYPVVTTYLGCDLLSKREGWIGRITARKSRGVIVMTEEMKRASGRSDARVIPFDADTSNFIPGLKSDARADLGLPPDKKLVLFPWDPSRRVKRFELARKSVDELKYERDVELLAVFGQPREVIAKYMIACDAMILTSLREGSPLAVREAMISGLPVISVDVGDVRQILETYNGGLIADADHEKIAEKLSLVFSGTISFFTSPPSTNETQTAAQKVYSLYQEIITP